MRRSHALLIVIAPAVAMLAALYAVRSAPAPVAEPAPLPAPSLAPAETAPPAPQAALPLAPEPAPPRVTLVAVGDIMLSRTVGKTIAAKGDVRFPYLRMRDWLRGADIAFANLETSVTPGRPVGQGEMLFRADPGTVDGLADAGFDVLSLANNHTPNFGQKGLKDTFRYLREAGIAFAGAGEDAAAARAPAVIERGGMRFAFLAFNDTDVVPASYAAGPAHAGTAFMDVAAMTEEVREARQTADVVIVSMHSGREYAYVPDASQVRFAR
ncbi:MAG TPA: CapA family protein, partial [Patescibacteria group bacterium]|nr:CapA family protein [Patescibacteria group bacterium]